MNVKLYDKVILKDGRRGDIVAILDPGVAYLVDGYTIEIRQSDIKEVL